MTTPETIKETHSPATASTLKNLDLPKGSTTRVNRTVQIPLTDAPWALLQIPYPMTEENWEEMTKLLNLMKRPLTQSNQG